MITAGVHTYSVGMVLTYKQFKKIWVACHKTGCIENHSNVWKKSGDMYCYVYLEQGVKIYLKEKSGKLYRIRVQIEPCRVLGKKDPTALFQADKRSYQKMVRIADKLLKKLHIPSIDVMKISRCDVTANIHFSSQPELMAYLRIFKKSLDIRNYDHVYFKKNDGKVKDYKSANAHSHCLSCKSANFLIYDKIAQLEMIDRCDESLAGEHVLRLEAELKRPSLKKHLGKNAMETNQGILSSAAHNSLKIIRWYMERLQPKGKKYIRYADAVEMIYSAKLKTKTRERMLYFLHKTSNRESLSTALRDLREKYGLSKNQCKTVLQKFQKLGISPVTLRNDSEYEALPYRLLSMG